MFFTHPVFLLSSIILAFAYYITIKKSRALRRIGAMIPLFIVLSVVTPLFNPNGKTVLFTYFGGRAYTLESLIYGVILAAMLIAVLTWFATYNLVMTSDKFMYIFGRAAPSISLVLSMILRLIPSFQKKAVQIAGARKSIGKAGDAGTKRERAENGMTVVSALTGWALEGGIITADSMRSRGYGSGKRTSFAIYRFDGRDIALLIIMIIFIGVIVFCGAMGGMTYIPGEAINMSNPYTIAGITAYTLFLVIPTALNIKESITWRILKSRI